MNSGTWAPIRERIEGEDYSNEKGYEAKKYDL